MRTKMTWRLDRGEKKAWVAALRSDQFEQGHGYLRDDQGRFCPLGVLAELKEVEWLPYESVYGVADKHGVVEPCYIPRSWVPKPVQEEIALLNDRGDSFRAIANWIDAFL